jgi:hypothetical protein
MASHTYQQFQYGLEKFPVTLYANIPVAASGAVGVLAPTKNQGIYSVTRSSAGVYVVTFGVLSQVQVDKYVRLIDASAVLLNATASGLRFEVVSDDTAAGSITVRFVGPTSASDTTPIAVDPPSGAVILMKMVLKNSSV